MNKRRFMMNCNLPHSISAPAVRRASIIGENWRIEPARNDIGDLKVPPTALKNTISFVD